MRSRRVPGSRKLPRIMPPEESLLFALASHFSLTYGIGVYKISSGRVASAHRGPGEIRDGRWFEALDDWGEHVARTRSRHLIDGSLSLDGFRSGWMAAMAALGHKRKSPARSIGSGRPRSEERLRFRDLG